MNLSACFQARVGVVVLLCESLCARGEDVEANPTGIHGPEIRKLFQYINICYRLRPLIIIQ